MLYSSMALYPGKADLSTFSGFSIPRLNCFSIFSFVSVVCEFRVCVSMYELCSLELKTMFVGFASMFSYVRLNAVFLFPSFPGF